MIRVKTPFETIVANYWEQDPKQLLSLLEQSFGIRVDADELGRAGDVATFVRAVKRQVDHPGRLERVAERLLRGTSSERLSA